MGVITYTPTLFWESSGKSMGVTHPQHTHTHIYLLKHLDGNHGCMDTHEVLCVSLKAAYNEGLVSLAGAATSIMFAATKHVFCCDKSMLAATKCLSQQNYVGHDKICLLWQKFCCDKHTFVVTKDVFCREENTCLSQQKLRLSQQNFCHNKKYVCRNKSFAVTRTLSLRQKMCFVTTHTCLLWQSRICRNKDTCGSSHQWQFRVGLCESEGNVWRRFSSLHGQHASWILVLQRFELTPRWCTENILYFKRKI